MLTDNELVALFNKGDISAFDDIYYKYYLMVRYLSKDEDYQQEIWLKVFLNLNKYKNKTFISWLRQLTQRTVIDLNRRKNTLKRKAVALPEQSEYEDIFEQINFKILSNNEFEVVFLRLNNKKFIEISQLTGIKLNSCITLHNRAVKKIKHDLVKRQIINN